MLDAILKATDERGEPLYTESTVRDFLALLAIATGEKRLEPVLRQFKIALDGAVPEGKIDDRIATYFERYPLPARLTTELQRLLRDSIADDVQTSTSAMQKVTGGERSRAPTNSAPVEGALRGGVFARVAASTIKR
jgi:hypothetical protein